MAAASDVHTWAALETLSLICCRMPQSTDTLPPLPSYYAIRKTPYHHNLPLAAPLCPVGFKGWKVMSVRVNGTGSMVAALVVGPEPARAVRMVVWCGESNTHHVHDFTPDSRVPVGLMWDSVEPKLLVVQTSSIFNEPSVEDKASGHGTGGDNAHGVDVAIIFVDVDKGVLLQEYQPIHQGGATACIGSSAPFLLTNRKSMVQPLAGSGGYQPFTSNVSRVLMSSFVGMQVRVIEEEEEAWCRAWEKGWGGDAVVTGVSILRVNTGTSPGRALRRRSNVSMQGRAEVLILPQN